jgi:hypothetical protein
MEFNLLNTLIAIYVISMLIVGFTITFLNDRFNLIDMVSSKLQEDDPDDSSLKNKDYVHRLVVALPFVPVVNTVVAIKFVNSFISKM